ncbi:glycosyltransferase family 4 protein [Thioalkalivibrio sulfidiphilus]|uniref:glycosyltransferase family 4 protein n=1 Tax=Thioalkalivibrio sulfidiphilus TaxID=1033854 RepID=UPI0009D9C6AC|nr:glycosyltransferase family 4 protein [Thioalkalivibrio sulfidiphilus]
MSAEFKKNILFVLPGPPFPVRDSGISMRYGPVVEHFSQTCHVDLVQIVHKWSEPMSDRYAGYFHDYATIDRRDWRRSFLKKVYGHLRPALYPRPPRCIYDPDARIVAEKLRNIINGKRYSVCVYATIDCFDGCVNVLREHCDRVVLDAIDGAYSHISKIIGDSYLGMRSKKLVRDWEVRLARLADAVTYISASDAASLYEAGGHNANVNLRIIPNGLYDKDFESHVAKIDGINPSVPVIGYLGNMGYTPNIIALEYLQELLPLVKAEVPNVKLLVIGKDPSGVIREKFSGEDVYVTGYVDSIWPYVNRVNLFVFPLKVGGGQQNKVLDVMLARKPIVLTSVANSGIGATTECHLLQRDTDVEIVSAIIALLKDADRARDLGESGHQFVLHKYGWPVIFNELEKVYFG